MPTTKTAEEPRLSASVNSAQIVVTLSSADDLLDRCKFDVVGWSPRQSTGYIEIIGDSRLTLVQVTVGISQEEEYIAIPGNCV